MGKRDARRLKISAQQELRERGVKMREQGMGYKEIAQILEITEGRVSQLHSQALKKLKTKFKQKYEKGGNYGNKQKHAHPGG